MGPECLKDIQHHVVVSFRAYINQLFISNFKGLIGKYPSQLYLQPMTDIITEYTKSQFLDLTSYPLKFDRRQINNFVYRSIELVGFGLEGLKIRELILPWKRLSSGYGIPFVDDFKTDIQFDMASYNALLKDFEVWAKQNLVDLSNELEQSKQNRLIFREDIIRNFRVN